MAWLFSGNSRHKSHWQSVPRRWSRFSAGELLEQRALLAASPIGAIAQTLGNDAASLYEASAHGTVQPFAAGANATNSAISPLMTIGDRVLIEAFPQNRQGNALENLKKIGFEQIANYQGAASGWLPIRNLDKLATTAGFSQLRPVYQPTLKAGSVLSEGDQALRADISRLNFDVDGRGITVGILSDSFNALGGAAEGIASGDLPAEGVRVLQDLPSFFGSDEGRAMAEIVHDIAPGASIIFATAFLGQVSFASNIIALVQAGADVIVDDVGYFNAPFFQDGIVAQAAQFAVASGVSFFSAAGNSADEAVDGEFVKSGVKDPDDAGNLHAFRRSRGKDDAPDTMQKITVPDGGVAQIILQWDSPFASAGFFGSSSDLAIYFMGADGTTVIQKQDISNVGGDAIEIITFENDGSHDLDGEAGVDETFNIAISLKKGNVSQFKYLYRGTITINEYNTRGSTVWGHSNAQDVIAVAAAPYFATPEFGSDSTVLESFSSLGGTEILFDSFGFNTSTGVRLQPTLTGIDGTDNTFFGRFFGTSAAAPHLAAVAALMLDSAGGPNSLSPSDIRAVMINSAADVTQRSGPRGTPIRVPTPEPPVGRGYDFYSGYGLVDANLAVGSVKKYAAVEGIAFSDDNGNGIRDTGEAGIPNIVVYLDRNNDGLLGYGEPAALSDATGRYRFSDLDAGTYSIRQVITPGYELVAPLGTVLVTVALGQFPHVDLANRPKFDYGDAPTPYVTSLAANGPRHGIQPGLYLGSSVDADSGSAVTGNGDFDDLNGVDDEDGVTFLTDLVRGSNTAVDIRATIGSNSPAVLQAWVDFDRDGEFDTPGEKVIQNQLLAQGTNRLAILTPTWAVVGPTYARFRYGYERDLGPLGLSRAGEVEDYRIFVSAASGTGIVVGDDNFAVAAGSSNNLLDVLANDFTSRGSLSVVTLGATSDGGVLGISGSQLTYTPKVSFVGTETFTYTVTNGLGQTGAGRVAVVVSTSSTTLNAVDDTKTVAANSSDNVIDLLANDLLPVGVTTQISRVTTPNQGGTVTVGSNGTVSYTPKTGFQGTETFEYTVTASGGGSDTALVTVNVESGTTAGVLAQLKLRTTDTSGNTITTISAGQDFQLRGFVKDVRNTPQGVFAAYLDVNYPESLLSVTGEIVHGENYPNGKSGDITVAGIIDEVGSTGNPELLGGAERLLFSVQLRAIAAGTATLTTDAADVLPRHAWVLYGASQALTADQFELSGTSIVITPAAGTTRLSNDLIPLDVNRDNYISAIDALLVINRLNEDSRKSASTFGASTSSASTTTGPLDVNRDGYISAIDALLVINELNRQSAAVAKSVVPPAAGIPASDIASTQDYQKTSARLDGTPEDDSWDLFADEVTATRRK